MGWKTPDYGRSHEGYAGAVLTDGSEPKPVYLDFGSGPTAGQQTREVWAYDGHLGRPTAAGFRGACTCGWRGPTHPFHAPQDGGAPQGPSQDLDVNAAHVDWCGHIDTVDRQTVPLPDELVHALVALSDQLEKVTDHAPIAALKAVAELELLTTRVAGRAAAAVEEDELPWETVGTSLGISVEAARARVINYSLRRR